MGMSEFYGETDWDESVNTIHRAYDLGVTFFDTADIYGTGHNEVLVGRALHDRRESVQIATKFGIDRSGGDSERRVRGTANYVKRSCDASLLRLGIDVIDLYYLHRPAMDAEIEETVGAMGELVAAGKVRLLGLSEVDNDLLRRACAIHPIAVVQSEYSLWTRDPETQVLDALRENNTALVAYSPLGRGFLTGTIDRSALGAKDFRGYNPRFAGAAGDANQEIAAAVAAVAARKGVAPAQVALAWVHGQASRLGINIVPIPGTKRVKWLEQNVAALDVELDAADLAELDALGDKVVGARY
jgi:aryl-alcohol dehydrogenase-like predicted oxidoreductase